MSNDNIVYVQIEIPLGHNVKYEINHETHQLICDRFLHGPFSYPFNYGFIQKTLGGDGDPLDAVVVCDRMIFPTSVVKCRIIGALITEDEAGRDEKVICVPVPSVDPRSKNIHNYTDLPEYTLTELRYFFSHYKDMEAGKFINVLDFIDATGAFNVYTQSIAAYMDVESN